MSDRIKLSRRNFLRGSTIAAGAAVLGGSLLKFEDLARAAPEDEHFFLFVELKGGVCWPYATDARDLSELPMDDAKIVRSVELKDNGETAPLNAEQQAVILNGAGANGTHGNVIILPYVGSLADTYRRGTTNAGGKWTLGVAGGSASAAHCTDVGGPGNSDFAAHVRSNNGPGGHDEGDHKGWASCEINSNNYVTP